MTFDWRRRQKNIGNHEHLSGQILDEGTGGAAVSSDTYVTQLVTNETFVTELVTNETFITEIVTNEFVTAVTENNTFVTELETITNNIYLQSGKLKQEYTPSALLDTPILFVIDGGGSAITTGVKGDIYIPWAGSIQSWALLADQSGSIVVDLWKDTYTNYPPTVGDTITASAKPTLSSATKGKSSTLTGWTTSVAADQTIRVNVDSASTVTRVTLALVIRKSF